MRMFAILGHPLGHTMSPPIHKRLFELSGSAAVQYRVFDIAPEELPARRAELLALDGFNVTIPHKVALLDWMDELDETAQRYGALNVVANRGGRHIGYNTDCYGFLKTVEMLGAPLSAGHTVCVLGAGGVGRMFAIESALSGARVLLAVRESGRAQAQCVQKDIAALCPAAEVSVAELSTLGEGFVCDLLINATPVGMYPSCDASPVPEAALAGCAFVFDCVYNPTETLLLRQAHAAGCRAAGGMAMLVWQAVRAHELWDNAVYKPQAITALIAEMEAAVNRDFH